MGGADNAFSLRDLLDVPGCGRAPSRRVRLGFLESLFAPAGKPREKSLWPDSLALFVCKGGYRLLQLTHRPTKGFGQGEGARCPPLPPPRLFGSTPRFARDVLGAEAWEPTKALERSNRVGTRLRPVPMRWHAAVMPVPHPVAGFPNTQRGSRGRLP